MSYENELLLYCMSFGNTNFPIFPLLVMYNIGMSDILNSNISNSSMPVYFVVDQGHMKRCLENKIMNHLEKNKKTKQFSYALPVKKKCGHTCGHTFISCSVFEQL